MKSISRAIVIMVAAILFLWVTVFARELGSREARERIAQALGIDKADQIHIKNISAGPGDEAIVVAQFTTAFRFKKEKSGDWVVADVRTGDRNWESVELIQTAVRKEKILRTEAQLNELATALEAFRRERGFYVTADDGSGLVDFLSPNYLNRVVRLDAWSNEFQYNGTAAGYRLASMGPDGKPDTSDDIVIENGRMRGASD